MVCIPTCYTEVSIEVRALNVTMPLNNIYQCFTKLASRTGGVGVAGPNPVAPTNKFKGLAGNGRPLELSGET